MSKPYDKLKAVPKLQPGKFACVGTKLLVHLLAVGINECEVAIGATEGPSFAVQEDSAQVLSDFFGEIAAQLRAK